jgi:DNA gyrase subunit A
MMDLPIARPDLTGLPPDIIEYIEVLEDALADLQGGARGRSERELSIEPSEAPTSINVITISAAGWAKRTPRHLYLRQRRGGMGIFDLICGEEDAPAFLLLAEEESGFTVLTNQGRTFRLAVRDLPEAAVNSRGRVITDQMPLRVDERISVVFADPLPGSRNAYLALVTERGQVRRIGSQYLGKNLQAGTVLSNVAEGGAPVAACWTSGHDDLFVVTRNGSAIRFAEKQVPVRGCLAIRVDPTDAVAAVAAAGADGGVFLLSNDGKGTIRLFSGFSANKAPGAGGKVAMKAERIVGAVAVAAGDDLFVISQLGKIIRFSADEVPPKEGVVQGVNCMNLRADQCVALMASPRRES